MIYNKKHTENDSNGEEQIRDNRKQDYFDSVFLITIFNLRLS